MGGGAGEEGNRIEHRLDSGRCAPKWHRMKSPDQARALGDEVVARARRAGADAADVGFSAHAALDVSVRLGALEDVGRSETEDLGLRVFCGRRNASVSTSDLAGAEIGRASCRERVCQYV